MKTYISIDIELEGSLSAGVKHTIEEDLTQFAQAYLEDIGFSTIANTDSKVPTTDDENLSTGSSLIVSYYL